MCKKHCLSVYYITINVKKKINLHFSNYFFVLCFCFLFSGDPFIYFSQHLSCIAMLFFLSIHVYFTVNIPIFSPQNSHVFIIIFSSFNLYVVFDYKHTTSIDYLFGYLLIFSFFYTHHFLFIFILSALFSFCSVSNFIFSK